MGVIPIPSTASLRFRASCSGATVPSHELNRTPAESIPDEFVVLLGPRENRVMQLVNRGWPQYSDGERRQLAQILLAVLAPLNVPDAKITDRMRAACGDAVHDWLKRHVTGGAS
jgi:hypothetical protein